MNGDWPLIGQNAAGHRFSPLTQIQASNVASLRLAWKYDMMRPGESLRSPVNNGRPAAPAHVADHAARRQRADVHHHAIRPGGRAGARNRQGDLGLPDPARQYGTPGQRSLAYRPADGTMPATIFFGTTGGFLLALDAETGTPSEWFGQRGAANLRTGMADGFPQANYGLTSPPVFYKDVIITGSRVQEQPALGPAGDVRGWNARTGKLLWAFHTVPAAR